MPTLRQLFLANNAQTTNFPLLLEFERAEGIYMYDKQGRAYADLISGIGVSNLGHSNPYVVSAIKEQLDKYMHLTGVRRVRADASGAFCRKIDINTALKFAIRFFYKFGLRSC